MPSPEPIVGCPRTRESTSAAGGHGPDSTLDDSADSAQLHSSHSTPDIIASNTVRQRLRLLRVGRFFFDFLVFLVKFCKKKFGVFVKIGGNVVCYCSRSMPGRWLDAGFY